MACMTNFHNLSTLTEVTSRKRISLLGSACLISWVVVLESIVWSYNLYLVFLSEGITFNIFMRVNWKIIYYNFHTKRHFKKHNRGYCLCFFIWRFSYNTFEIIRLRIQISKYFQVGTWYKTRLVSNRIFRRYNININFGLIFEKSLSRITIFSFFYEITKTAY